MQNSIPTNKLYLYHMVPKNMQGSVLFPLNSLKENDPDLYLSHAKKYENRQDTMKQYIPTLECLWNDAIHLFAVDPTELNQARVDAGLMPLKMKLYQIDPNMLDPKNTTIFFLQRTTL